MAFTFASGCLILISLCISSTHHMLQPISKLVMISYLCLSFVNRQPHTTKLYLPRTSTSDNLSRSYSTFQTRSIPQTAHAVQDLWYSIISKYCDVVDVMKLSVIFATETCPYVSDKNLCSLEKTDTFAIFKEYFITETRKISC